MVREVLKRPSKGYGDSPRSWCLPRSGTECDTCGRKSAPRVRRRSIGVKLRLIFFVMAIEVGGVKRPKQSNRCKRFIQDSQDTWCRDLPEVKVGLRESTQTDQREIDDPGQG